MPLDSKKEGKKERRMERQRIQAEAYAIDGGRPEWIFLWSIVYLV